MKPSTLNLNLTKTEMETASMFSKVPDGDYVVSVAHSQFKDGKKPGSAGLQVGYMIEEGAHKGKLIQDYINIANENEQAVEIGHRRLKAIMTYQKRTSFVLKTDAELVSRAKFMISTVLETSMYKEKEIESVSVKKLFALEEKVGSATTAKATTTKAAPAKTAPVVEESDAHVDEDAGDDEAPPWMK